MGDQDVLRKQVMQDLVRPSSESLYHQLGRLRTEMPNLSQLEKPETLRWLGRAVALIEAAGAGMELAALRVELMGLGQYQFPNSKKSIAIALILETVLAKVKLRLPTQSQGAFIPAGGTFDAFQAVGKAVSSAVRDVLMVDPYADEAILTDFAVQVPAGVLVRVLSDAATCKPSLLPAAQRWVAQYGATRPLQSRQAPARALHDRLIIVDETTVWVLGQSFKDLAKRSPSSLVRMDTESAGLKASAYRALWASGSILV